MPNTLTRAAPTLLIALVAACAGAASLPQTPPTGRSSQPVDTPSGSTCNLVTAREMSEIWGVEMTAVPGTDNDCEWTASTGLPSFSMRFEPTDLDTARALMGNDADVDIAGHPAVIGNLPGGLTVYTQVGSVDLVVQTVTLEDTPANRELVIATARKAITRVR